MATQYDDKGKFYTDIISKVLVPVIIHVGHYRMQGNVHVRSGYRLKDEMNEPDTFIAVTNALVFDLNGVVLYQTDFIAINREHIDWIIPEDELITDQPQEGGGE